MMELSEGFSRVTRKIRRLKRSLVRRFYFLRVLQKLETIARPCVLCGNNLVFKQLYAHDRYDLPLSVVSCGECGLIQERPTPTETFLDRFYRSSMYRGLYLGIVKASERNNDYANEKAAENAAYIDSFAFPKETRVLDVGSAYGASLIEYKRRNPTWKIYGVEPGSNFSTQKAAHLDGLHDSIEAIPSGETFDLITLWHVLEHFFDPVETLQKIGRHLSHEGRIIIEVPNAEKYRGLPDIHIAHLFHFTTETLAGLVRKAGLSVEQMSGTFFRRETPVIRAVLRKP